MYPIPLRIIIPTETKTAPGFRACGSAENDSCCPHRKRQFRVRILRQTKFVLLHQDEDFAHLFPKVGQPAESPWRLALVKKMQFIEGLSDRQAAAAVRGIIDWKYLLSLELTDPGFDFSILSDFRERLIEGKAERLLLDKMLEKFKERKLLKVRGNQRTDSTHIPAAVRTLNRFVKQ